MSDRRRFGEDERGVSEVLGAVLVFGLAIALVVLLQVTAIPSANEEVEFKHSLEVQEDLQHMRTSIVNAGADGETYSATIRLGTSYPSRLLFLNPPSPSGSIKAEAVGDGSYQSSDIDLRRICGLGDPDNLPTKHIIYRPDYNHYSGDDPHRYENTVYYQDSETTSNTVLNRTRQAFVRPNSRSIALYPIQGNLSQAGFHSVTLDFNGGEQGRDSFSNFNITVPTKLSAGQWDQLISSSDVTIGNASGSRPDMKEFEFTGEWAVRCHPVGLGGPPNQTVTPFTPPPPNSGSGGNGSAQINPNGSGAVAFKSASLSSDNSEVTVTFENLANQPRTIIEARVAFYSTDVQSSSGNELPEGIDFQDEGTPDHNVGGPFQDIDNVSLSPRTSPNNEGEVIIDYFCGQSSSSTRYDIKQGDYFALSLKFANGATSNYFIDPPGGGTGSQHCTGT